MLNHKPHAPLRLRVQDMQRSDRQEILGRLLLEQQATNNGPVTVSYHQRKVVGGSYPSYGGNAVLDMRTLLCERALLTLPDKGVAPQSQHCQPSQALYILPRRTRRNLSVLSVLSVALLTVVRQESSNHTSDTRRLKFLQFIVDLHDRYFDVNQPSNVQRGSTYHHVHGSTLDSLLQLPQLIRIVPDCGKNRPQMRISLVHFSNGPHGRRPRIHYLSHSIFSSCNHSGTLRHPTMGKRRPILHNQRTGSLEPPTILHSE